jgi:hypothetical protein
VLIGPDSMTTDVTFESHELQQLSIVEEFGELGLLVITGAIYYQDCLPPGIHTLGSLKITYSSSPGESFVVDTSSFGDARFLHHVYGSMPDDEIGVPTVITSAVSPYPNMSVEPDSLFFSTLTSIPITEPDTFTVLSSEGVFAWTLTHSDWLEVVPTEGISGQKVSVLPLIEGLPVGFHYGEVTVSSDGVVGSPQVVTVELELKQTYPSFDANCDGSFDVDDIVVLIMYVFAAGDPPCDPCAGR